MNDGGWTSTSLVSSKMPLLKRIQNYKISFETRKEKKQFCSRNCIICVWLSQCINSIIQLIHFYFKFERFFCECRRKFLNWKHTNTGNSLKRKKKWERKWNGYILKHEQHLIKGTKEGKNGINSSFLPFFHKKFFHSFRNEREKARTTFCFCNISLLLFFHHLLLLLLCNG